MRIAHVTYHYKPIIGGQEALTDALVHHLDSFGFEQVIYQSDWGFRGDGVVVIPKLPRPVRFGALDQYVFQARLLASQLTQLRHSDLLIVHYALYCPLLLWHPRVIVFSHGRIWDTPTRKLNHKMIKFVSQRTFQRTGVVANDTDYLRHMGLPLSPAARYFEEVAPGKWFVPNCIDIEHFRPTQPLPELAGRDIILVARNLRYERGIHLAIQAFAHVLKRYQGVVLVIVGTTWAKEYEAFCKRLAHQLAIDKQVVFWGPASRQLMPAIYSSALMSLVPSLLTEGTSLSALEGMACGIPTIASDVGGLKDLPCLHTPENDAAALGEKVLLLLQDERKRQELGQRQQAVVRATFNFANWKQAWQQVVQKAFQ
ncbi:MAG: glycosyltransferase family 4 protein [Terriglobia bacterium]